MTIDRERLTELLESLKRGETDTDSLVELLSERGYEDIEFAKVDHRRKARTGYPEVIYGEGKTPEQAAEIFARLVGRTEVVICTRASQEMANAIILKIPGAVYHEVPGATHYGVMEFPEVYAHHIQTFISGTISGTGSTQATP